MAHPPKHAQSSARKFGGKAEDYLPIRRGHGVSSIYALCIVKALVANSARRIKNRAGSNHHRPASRG